MRVENPAPSRRPALLQVIRPSPRPSAHWPPRIRSVSWARSPSARVAWSSSSTASSTTLPVVCARFERALWTWSMAPGWLRHARRGAWPRPTAYVVDSCFRPAPRAALERVGSAVKLRLTRAGGHGCPGWLSGVSLRGLLRRGRGARMTRARLDRSRAPGAGGEDLRISRSEAGGVADRATASVLRVDWTPDDSRPAAETLVTCARRSTQPREAPDPFLSSSPDRSGAIELGADELGGDGTASMDPSGRGAASR